MQPYHMTKKEREITDPQVMADILRKGKFTVISLCRDNEPYVVTLSYGYDESSRTLYFHAGNSGLKLEFLRENPVVCGTVIEDRGYLTDECAHAYRSVVFWGKMTVVQSLEEKKQGMEVLFNQLEENPAPIKARTLKKDAAYDAVAVLRLRIDHITGKQGQ
jgi:uncharacterized protein